MPTDVDIDQMPVTLDFTIEQVLDIMLASAERKIDAVEMMKHAIMEDLYR